MLERTREDIRTAGEKDAADRRLAGVLSGYPDIHAVRAYRLWRHFISYI